MDGIFKVLFKNPGKLMNMVKKIGGNLDNKIKSGEIKESELIEEASELMKKLENMPGMKNMKEMMSNMGMPMGGGGKLNMGAMKGQMKRNIGKAKTRERLRKKLEQRKSTYEAGTPPALALQQQIERTEARFDKYSRSELLCGTDGLPHLIADGQIGRAHV